MYFSLTVLNKKIIGMKRPTGVFFKFSTWNELLILSKQRDVIKTEHPTVQGGQEKTHM